MPQQLEAYQKLLQQLMDLEQQLMCAFEAQVKIHPPPREFLELYRPKFDHIDWANSTISQLLTVWPQDVHFAIVLLLSKQMTGVIVLNGQHWLFSAHGSDEVSFTHLSPTWLFIFLNTSSKARRTCYEGCVRIIVAADALKPNIFWWIDLIG